MQQLLPGQKEHSRSEYSSECKCSRSIPLDLKGLLLVGLVFAGVLHAGTYAQHHIDVIHPGALYFLHFHAAILTPFQTAIWQQQMKQKLDADPFGHDVSTHKRLRWLGHTARMLQDRMPFQCMFRQSPGTKARGKPRDIWQTTVYKDPTSIHVQYKWVTIAQDQTISRQLIAAVRT